MGNSFYIARCLPIPFRKEKTENSKGRDTLLTGKNFDEHLINVFFTEITFQIGKVGTSHHQV